MTDTNKEARFFIRKQGYFYRPNSRGYTSSAICAGLYTEEEAIRITHPNGPDGPRDGMSCIAEHIWHDDDWQKYRSLLAERDALRKAVDGYAYIGRDGKVTLAKDLEDERDQLRNQLHAAHNAGLDAAINCINEFLSSERIGSHEYIKGQTECMLHLRDKINAMKLEGN